MIENAEFWARLLTPETVIALPFMSLNTHAGSFRGILKSNILIQKIESLNIERSYSIDLAHLILSNYFWR
jgi:hypothetical protein